jgi:plastocyanin
MPFCSLPTRPAISMALLAALLLGACGPTTTAAPGGTAAQASPATAAPPTARASAPAVISGPQIVIGNFTFTPNALTVAVGTTVTWVNHDDIPHTVTAQDHSFTSSGLDTEDSFTHQFIVAGTYAYYCTIHTKMTATITVR